MPDISELSHKTWLAETDALNDMIASLDPLAPLEHDIRQRARQMVERLRGEGAGAGVEAFLQEYGLNTQEGIAIMCLAEALLRIPDSETAGRLIRDKFEGANWEKHLGGSDSLFVNASSWGLLLTGKVVNFSAGSEEKPAHLLGKMVARFGDPVIREALKKAMRFIGTQFVLGEDVEEALKRSVSYAKQGYRFSYDILGEGARSDAQAQSYVKAYHHAITQIGAGEKPANLFHAPSISVKLSALHARYSLSQSDRVFAELLPRLKGILLLARQHGIAVSLDAEEANRLDVELSLFERIFADPELAGWEGLGFVLQAYQKRAFHVIDWLAGLAQRHQKRMPLRLVKGAYWDWEIKHAQIQGLASYPVFTRKEHTDVSYIACANKIMANKHAFFPQFATHNARTIASIQLLARHYGLGSADFEFQRLHGMGEKLYAQVVGEYACRVYAPIGEHKDLLAYLIRRLLENGANSSFVHLLMDEDVPVEKLLANPVDDTKAYRCEPNPLIPLPEQIYPGRKNSRGLDWGYISLRKPLEDALSSFPPSYWKTPANTPLSQADALMESARSGFAAWASTTAKSRADILEKAADLLAKNQNELVALLAHEAKKTLPDAIAEVREAADFCRYYAAEARRLFAMQELRGPTGESNRLLLHPRGVFVCISPWNFPLAIFIGQVVAALVCGNSVIAKPAEQTPAIAVRAVALLKEAGVPESALALAVGDGRVGAALVAHEKTDGVVFTGSVEVAQSINRSLAGRKGPIAPLIAETGGQNCMVVDSSALLEQAVDDIILSAFGSAGQRCSALRVLFVQEDIADALLALLSGAMQELRLGDPIDLSTDIGPVIDADAKAMLLAHIESMKKKARLVACAPLLDSLSAKGHFVAPHVFEIGSISELEKEIFGPVLHVVRFKASALEQVAADINSTGYGLTFGIHSRIEDHIDFFCSRIRAGNLYVNRGMTGAVVGVQPFGGEGLSGTGPKAGGPHYLLRFVCERTTSINTAAIGGNLQLLSS